LSASPYIRRVVLWRWTERATGAERLRAKEGLAYISYASAVDAIDFGEDIGRSGDANYGLAMLRDHRDKQSWDSYNSDPHHYRVGNYIDTLTHEQLTARADYLYDGPPSVPGGIRHIALYCWLACVAQSRKEEARQSLARLRAACKSVQWLGVANDLGWASVGRADLVVEAHFQTESDVGEFLEDPAQREASALLASLTIPGRTAQLQHYMRSG
jgi:hypothetical protein